jgi:hypothetical protein
MMHKKTIFELPFPTTSLICDPVLRTGDDGGLLVSMKCDNGNSISSFSLSFEKPRAFRKRAEIYCTPWHISDAYDTVCEIFDSDWVVELKFNAIPEWRDKWVMRHFMIYIDSFGCLEVVGEDVRVLAGEWS